MADGSGWGDALSLTIRTLYLWPALPHLRCARLDTLTDEQAHAVLGWRKEAARLLGYTRHLDDQLDKLLGRAEERLESVQGELAAAWACRASWRESGWQEAPPCASSLYAAVMALSRTAGPEVLLSDRVAVDLIESMTGRVWVFGENRPGITRAKKWLESRGYLAIKSMKGSGTTVYCLLQGSYADSYTCLVAKAPGVPDSRPVLGELDRLAFRVSVDRLRAKGDWRPGRAVAEARSELEERRQQEEDRQERDDTMAEAPWHLLDTDFSEELPGGELPEPGTRRCDDDDEEPGAGRR